MSQRNLTSPSKSSRTNLNKKTRSNRIPTNAKNTYAGLQKGRWQMHHNLHSNFKVELSPTATCFPLWCKLVVEAYHTEETRQHSSACKGPLANIRLKVFNLFFLPLRHSPQRHQTSSGDSFSFDDQRTMESLPTLNTLQCLEVLPNELSIRDKYGLWEAKNCAIWAKQSLLALQYLLWEGLTWKEKFTSKFPSYRLIIYLVMNLSNTYKYSNLVE